MKEEPTESDPVSSFSRNGFLFGFLGRGPCRLCYSAVSGAFCHFIHKFFKSSKEKTPPSRSLPIRTPQWGPCGPGGVKFNSRHTGGSLTAVARCQSICQPEERVS